MISKYAVMAIVWSIVLVTPLDAQRGRTDVRRGNRLYEEGQYDEARNSYLDALRAAPNSPLVRFNEANALYQTEEFQSALDAYQEALEAGDPALASSAWYNLGNALYRQEQLQESIDAYKQSLRLDPDDLDAKHNLELALEQLQQQQQQQQNQDDNQQQQDQRQDDQQQQQQQEQQQDDAQQDQQQQQQDQEDQQDQQDQQELQQGEQPREMTREEAERLLQAIDEDPEGVKRRMRDTERRRRVRKPW